MNMNAPSLVSRRRFLETSAIAAAALPFLAAGGEITPGKGKPKVGCLSWCFHDFSPGVDPEPAIDIIGGLGFDGVELIVTARADLESFWNDQRVDRLRKKLDQKKLQVSKFVLF